MLFFYANLTIMKEFVLFGITLITVLKYQVNVHGVTIL